MMKGTKKKGSRGVRGASKGRAGKGTAQREFEYRPLTAREAEDLVDRFIGTEDDGAALAFVRLLNGIVQERYAERGDVEGLARVAATRAYTKTIHGEQAFDEFAMLDPDDRAGLYPGVALRPEAEVSNVGTIG
jgi:hypothetical protein